MYMQILLSSSYHITSLHTFQASSCHLPLITSYPLENEHKKSINQSINQPINPYCECEFHIIITFLHVHYVPHLVPYKHRPPPLPTGKLQLNPLLHNQIPNSLDTPPHQDILRNHPPSAIVPANTTPLPTPRIPNRVNHTINTPHAAQHSRSNRVPQTSNEHCAEGGDVVFVAVLMRALGRVEG